MIGGDRWPIWLGYLNYSLPTHSGSHKEPLTGDLLSQEISPVSYFYSSWLTWCRLPASSQLSSLPCLFWGSIQFKRHLWFTNELSLDSIWLCHVPWFVWERSLHSFKKTRLEEIQLRRKSIKQSCCNFSNSSQRIQSSGVNKYEFNFCLYHLLIDWS